MQKTAYGSRVGMLAQMLRIMKLTSFGLLVFCVQVSANSVGQRITFSGKDVPLVQVFSKIREQTGYIAFYKADLLKDSKPVTVSVSDVPLTDFLDIALKNQDLSYLITDKTIMLSRKRTAPAPVYNFAPLNTVPIIGFVSSDGKPVAGATVIIRPLNIALATNDKGAFMIPNIPPGNYTIEVTSIGFSKATKKITVSESSQSVSVNIVLEQQLTEQEEVVISTGYSTKKTGELTGSVQKISGDDLRRGLTTSDPVSLLKGRATGLYISEQNAGDPTSSGGQIFVRGRGADRPCRTPVAVDRRTAA